MTLDDTLSEIEKKWNGTYIFDALLLRESIVHLMTEWLFAEAGQIMPPPDDLWMELSSPELSESVQAYSANIKRIQEFWTLVPQMMDQASAMAVLWCESSVNVTGKVYPVSKAPDLETFDVITKDLQSRLANKFLAADNMDDAIGTNLGEAVRQFDFLARGNLEFDGAIFATLGLQISATWTAFEVLCGDLWRALFKRFPTAITPPKRGDYNFQSLIKIKEAYAALIPGSARIIEILDDVRLRKLNLLRNLLEHQGGVVDAKFLGHARDIDWTDHSAIERERFPLNGVVVRDLANPVIQKGVDLIRAAGTWSCGRQQGNP